MKYYYQHHDPAEPRRCPACGDTPSKCIDPVEHYDPDWEEDDD